MQQMITLTLKAEREDDQYVSICPELDLSSYGETTDEAIERLDNMILLYLDTIEADGERERIFKERGIKVEDRLEANYTVSVHPGVTATVVRFPIGRA
jgi:predicted RNase H-like HicB family nuclease